MDISLAMTQTEQARVAAQTGAFNQALGNDAAGSTLGQDDFLKILLTQLQNQDPTQPMEDKEFIAQMAQFSSLEQMTNMSQGFERLSGLLTSGQALSVLGRTVDVRVGEQVVRGTVSAVQQGAIPQIVVGGETYELSDIESILN